MIFFTLFYLPPLWCFPVAAWNGNGPYSSTTRLGMSFCHDRGSCVMGCAYCMYSGNSNHFLYSFERDAFSNCECCCICFNKFNEKMTVS